MSYCVNCGVELDVTAKECVLCNTPVYNPKEIGKYTDAKTPFPKEKGQVEAVKRKDLGILFSVMMLAIALACGIVNAFIFKGALWSLAVIGVCGMLWVTLIPALIYVGQPVYLSILWDGLAVAVYLYMLTFLTESDKWFLGLGMPIAVLITLVAEAFTLCVRKLPKSFLTVLLYTLSAIALVCLGLEILIDLYVSGMVSLLWSAVVVTVCVVLDVMVITMLSLKRLRNAVRRRLHF